jgi:polyisoprenyl-teichoic acid--peptidoglycan teichoic acid transferase
MAATVGRARSAAATMATAGTSPTCHLPIPRSLGFPVYYPTALPGSTRFSDDSRTYEYKDPDDDVERAYKLVFARPNPTITEEYFGMMGTTWEDPPILESPSMTKTIDGREYLLFYAGDRLRLVGWKEDGNSYWISNSLLETLSENEMLEIAKSVELASPK